MTEVSANPQTQQLEFGTVSFSFDVAINGHITSDKETITFNGNQTATLVMNGMAYTLKL